MALPIYSTGTVSVTTGGAVTVSSGIWSGINVVAGDVISVDGGPTVLIRDVSDATHAQLAGWTGGSVSSKTYAVYQNSPRRFDDVQIADDLRKQVQALNTQGFYVFVPSSATEPDPSLGDDGQYAFQATTGKLWVKSGGVWVPIGVYKGVNPRGVWSGATAYVVNDVVSRNGNAYMAIAANTNSAPPSANWMVLGTKGDQGIQGPQGDQGLQGIQGPQGDKGDQGEQGVQGRSYGGTSVTSMTIGIGNKTFEIQGDLAFAVGDRVHIGAIGDELNWMDGFVTAYSGTSMTVAASDFDGGGTFDSWGVGLTGKPGAGDGDMKGANNLSDLTDPKTARGALGLSVLPWSIVGLVPYNDPTTPNTTLGVSPGSAADSLNEAIISLPYGLTKRIDASWAEGDGEGGLDTGSVSAYACYHIFIIQKAATGTVDVLFSLSATSPTLPGGYNRFRRIGAFRVNVSSEIYPGIWYPDGEFVFNPPVPHYFPSPSTVSLFTTFGPIGIKAKVKYRFVANDTATGNPYFGVVFIDPAVGLTEAPNHYIVYKPATIAIVAVVESWTDTLARAYAGGTGSGTSAYTQSVILGWHDLRNENQ